MNTNRHFAETICERGFSVSRLSRDEASAALAKFKQGFGVASDQPVNRDVLLRSDSGHSRIESRRACRGFSDLSLGSFHLMRVKDTREILLARSTEEATGSIFLDWHSYCGFEIIIWSLDLDWVFFAGLEHNDYLLAV